MRSILLLMGIAFSLPLSASDDIISDIRSAERYCDECALAGVEGIWEFPDDETMVFVRRNADKKGHYNIILLESPDCRFEPGEIVGSMESTSDRSKYSMSLRIEKSKDIMSTTRSCVAILDRNGTSIQMKPLKLKVSFRTMWFLPKFWRSIKVSVDNPKSELPIGLVKIYPDNSQELPLYF